MPPTSSAAFDASVALAKNRNEMAEAYTKLLQTYPPDHPDWPAMNHAIMRRWSLSGLRYIKDRAWAALQSSQ